MQFFLRVLVASLFLTSRCSAKSTATNDRSAECASDDDCNGKSFCAGGFCQDFGVCRNLSDCLNPSNEYKTAKCAGYIDCVDNRCMQECDSNAVCPDGLPSVRCMAAPCSVSTCVSPIASCVDYYCGGCNALFFDPMGDLSCGSVTNENTLEPTIEEEPATNPCDSDSECDDDEYCGHGECQNFGSCTSDVDCLNPSNMYSTIFCVGPLQCLEGSCGRTCGAECPEKGGEPVPCGDFTCDTDSCDEDARCILNDCDECFPIFLDAAGNRVCDSDDDTPTSSVQDVVCLSDDDCDDQFCAGGFCQDFGVCRNLADCLNPSNEYSTVFCVGYIDCVDNQCVKECGSNECPDDQPLVECQAPPCIFSTCTSPSTCVDYYCGSCNALFFDPMGDLSCGAVKNDNTLEPETTNDTECSSDADCSDGGYCAGGSCLTFGSCDETVDCFNPSNIFPVLECTGHVTCNSTNGLCETICGPECPDDKSRVNCFVAPCEATSCNEEYVSCMDDYCGGCNAIFLNSEGQQVCTGGTDDVDTTSAACLEKEDCSTTGSWFSWSKCSVQNAIAKVFCSI